MGGHPGPLPSSTKLGTLTVLPPLAAPSRPAGDAPSLAGIAITAPIALVNWRGVPGAPGRLRPLRSR